MTCRGRLLAEAVALADGSVLVDVGECPDPAAHVVIVRREGIEFAAELCLGHALAAELDTGFVRTIRKRVRT